MVEQAGALPAEAETSPADSRAEFVASLGRRLEALRQALFALEQAPKSPALRDHLRRRIHAFGAAAGVLGFDRVFEAFREAESVLGRPGAGALGVGDLALVARTVDLVPSLVLVADAPVGRGRPPPGSASLERRGGVWPTSVLVFGAAALAESLETAAVAGGSPGIECERTEDPDRAEEIVRVLAPDVAVIDADRKGARELMETLVYDPLLDPVRIIAVGSFDRPEAAAGLVALGVARVLPKPVSPESLKRSVLEVSRERSAPVQRVEPIGEVTIEALGERVAHEIHRGLVEAVKAQSRGATVQFGDGTDVLAAVWSSVARIRELVTLRSGGAVRFEATGPEGAVPLSPVMSDDRARATGRGEARSADGVSLSGRTVVVADDDPAVVWFLSGLLRAAGAEVLEAHDGSRALELVRASWPDLVVSDILMPGLDGFALCREIKRDVALSDIPVILLSWKEDLLQRVRELGADADGYLRKEATASTVVQRVREVLLPRARVEARIAAGGDARGRLDGLTPRLILELVCRSGGNARITMRDAAFLYEVDIRGGRLCTATRTTPNGMFERGPRALSALLGVRAGRFAVRQDDSSCPRDWDVDLRELLREDIERVRAAQRILSDLGAVARIDIDEAAIAPYLAATPQSAGAIVRRLAEGVPPSAVVAAGASARLLESVLVDVVLHGAVLRLVGPGGEDLLAADLAAARERHAALASPTLREFRTPPPAHAVFDTRPDGAPSLPTEPEPLVHSRAPPEAVSAQLVSSVALVSPMPLVSPVALVSPVPAAATANVTEPPRADPGWESAAPPAARAAEEVVPAEPAAPVEPAVAPVQPGGPEGGFDGFFAAGVAPPDPEREPPRSALKGLAPPTSAPAEPSPLEVALRSVPAPQSRSRAEESPRPAPARSPRIAATGLTESTSAPARSLPPRPSPKVPALEAPNALDFGDGLLSVLGAEPTPPPRLGDPSASRADDGSTRADPPRETAVDVAPTPREGGIRLASDSPEERRDPSVAPRGAISSVRPGEASPRAAPPLSARGPVSSGPPQGRPASGAAAQNSAPAPGDSGGFLGILGVVAVAAAASFALVSALRSGEPAAPAPQASSPAAAGSASAPPPVASVVGVPSPTLQGPPPAVPAPAALAMQDLELPAGLAVAPDRGLLEVEVGAAQSIYVDGVFVGRGPLRQVPLREGPHEVRVQGEGVDVVRRVEVHKARRAHLGVTSPR
jgi:CheY-like chemotaxis protein